MERPRSDPEPVKISLCVNGRWRFVGAVGAGPGCPPPGCLYSLSRSLSIYPGSMIRDRALACSPIMSVRSSPRILSAIYSMIIIARSGSRSSSVYCVRSSSGYAAISGASFLALFSASVSFSFPGVKVYSPGRLFSASVAGAVFSLIRFKAVKSSSISSSICVLKIVKLAVQI